MSNLPWLKLLPWIIAAAMALAAATCLHLYQSERDAFVAYRAGVTAIGKAQEEQVRKQEAQAAENLKQVRKDYEDKIPSIRRDAVTAYRLRNPQSGSCAMPGNSASQSVDDGTQPAGILVDPSFIEDVAETISKLKAFQDKCKRDNCPIKD